MPEKQLKWNPTRQHLIEIGKLFAQHHGTADFLPPMIGKNIENINDEIDGWPELAHALGTLIVSAAKERGMLTIVYMEGLTTYTFSIIGEVRLRVETIEIKLKHLIFTLDSHLDPEGKSTSFHKFGIPHEGQLNEWNWDPQTRTDTTDEEE